jgi:hypothetical protein
MTPEERQALREKHKPYNGRYEGEWCSYCEYFNVDSNGWTVKYNSIPYPCDIIKVLDWADEVLDELKGLTAHFEGIWY